MKQRGWLKKPNDCFWMENIFCLESHIHLCSRHTSANPAYVIKTCLIWHAFSGARYWGFVSPKLHVSTYRNQQHCWWFQYFLYRCVSCLVLRVTRYNLQMEYSGMWTEGGGGGGGGGADCYSQYRASWTLAVSSRLAADGRRDEEGGRSLLLNWPMVSELTVSGCSKFHSGIVLRNYTGMCRMY